MRWRATLTAAVLASAVVYAPAWAFFGDDEARKQIAELKKTVDGLAGRMETSNGNQLDFANQIETLKTDLARLRGQVEEVGFAVEAAHKRQQDFYVDLDNRLRSLEKAAAEAAKTAKAAAEAARAAQQAAAPATDPAPTAPGAPPAAAGAPQSPPPATASVSVDPQSEIREYETALGHFREGRFKEAQLAFLSFIDRHRQSNLLPSAQYWLGSSLYQQKGFLQAAAAFGQVATKWPQDSRAPEALLQQSNALVAAKDVPGAIKVLQNVLEKYPSSPAAPDARARLKTLAPSKVR